MQIEQRVPPPTNEEERYGWAVPKFLNKETTGYRMFCITDGTRRLDELFGLDLAAAGETTPDARQRLRLATTFFAHSIEAFHLVEYFARMAGELNHFVALPPEEIPGATNGRIADENIRKATEDGYIRRAVFSGVEDVELIELTTKFGHMFEAVERFAETFPTSDGIFTDTLDTI